MNKYQYKDIVESTYTKISSSKSFDEPLSEIIKKHVKGRLKKYFSQKLNKKLRNLKE